MKKQVKLAGLVELEHDIPRALLRRPAFRLSQDSFERLIVLILGEVQKAKKDAISLLQSPRSSAI
ncbi:hypothetical protein [Aquamicrobium ahrensii]|uniref:Transposase n=1 Tax=Aquamicrobium ahrensii TaxID=469551 RepID=A0ABV2KLT8_9HYPH